MGHVNPDERWPAVERTARIAVPVGMAVFTWLVLLVAAGVVLRLDVTSPLNLLSLFVVAILSWPLVAFAPWRDGVTDRVLDWLARKRWTLLVTAGLVLLLTSPLAAHLPRPLVVVLRLPDRASGIFFGAAVFYRQHLGAIAGRVVFRFGQWYLAFLWLHVIAGLLVPLAGTFGRVWER